ncbi:MAG: hypothetical protein DCF31_05465 [Alphaproteobacteria bacterium]|nr:MAG: hypothetical protein DCF31_05465 [Alphaproteobacteria bacterium]
MVDDPALPLAFVQNCYVVDDLDAAVQAMHRRFGIGPFVGGGIGELENHVYRGRPAAPIRMRGVFVQSGDLNIELVQILSDGPCAFTDMYTRGRQGLHHAAIFCADYAATRDRLVADGAAVASEFTVSFGATICYVDTRTTLGHMIELYPENAIIRGMYAEARDAAANWDRRQLMIPWQPRS